MAVRRKKKRKLSRAPSSPTSRAMADWLERQLVTSAGGTVRRPSPARHANRKIFELGGYKYEIDEENKTITKIANPKKPFGIEIPDIPKWQIFLAVLGLLVLLAMIMLGGPASQTVNIQTQAQTQASVAHPVQPVQQNNASQPISQAEPATGAESILTAMLNILPLFMCIVVLMMVMSTVSAFLR